MQLPVAQRDGLSWQADHALHELEPIDLGVRDDDDIAPDQSTGATSSDDVVTGLKQGLHRSLGDYVAAQLAAYSTDEEAEDGQANDARSLFHAAQFTDAYCCRV